MDGETVLIRARVQTSRAQGTKMVFLNLRQRTDSVQALLTVNTDSVSKQMVKWAASLQDESIVLVEGVVKKSPEIIKSASVGDVELHLSKVNFYLDSERLFAMYEFVSSGLPGLSHFWPGWTTSVQCGGRKPS